MGTALLKDVVERELEEMPAYEKPETPFDPSQIASGATMVESGVKSKSAHYAEELYADLRILIPNGQPVMIEKAWLVGPACYPYLGKSFLAAYVRRGDSPSVRVLFAIAGIKTPILNGGAVLDMLGDFFTKEEVRTVLKGMAFNLPEWKNDDSSAN